MKSRKNQLHWSSDGLRYERVQSSCRSYRWLPWSFLFFFSNLPMKSKIGPTNGTSMPAHTLGRLEKWDLLLLSVVERYEKWYEHRRSYLAPSQKTWLSICLLLRLVRPPVQAWTLILNTVDCPGYFGISSVAWYEHRYKQSSSYLAPSFVQNCFSLIFP